MRRPLFALRLSLIPLSLLALGGACTDDDPPVRGESLAITHEEARDSAVANVRAMMDAAWRTEMFLHDAPTLDEADSVIAALTGSEDEATEPDPIEEPPSGLVLPLDQVDFDELKQSVEDELVARVFRDDQIESRTATSIVYRIDPARICESQDVEGELDPDCMKALEAVPLRIAVSSVVEGDIDLRLLVGTDRAEAALLELHADVLALSLNVGPILDAFIDAFAAIDPEAQAPSLVTARGTVRLALRRLSENQLRVSADIVSPVTVQATVDGEDFKMAAGVGTIALDVDRAAATASLEVDVRDVSVTAPKAVLESEDSCYNESGEYDETACDDFEGTVSIALERFAGIASLIDLSQSLSIDGLIAGPATLSFDGDKIFEIALNDETTPLDVVATTAPGVIALALDGTAIGSLLVELGRASDVLDLEPGWYMSDLLTAELPDARTEARLTTDGVMLDKGRVILESRARPDLDRTIEPGQCIQGSEPQYDENGEPLTPYHPFDIQVGPTCGGVIPPS